MGAWFSNPGLGVSLTAHGTGVGKYLKAKHPAKDVNPATTSVEEGIASKKRKVVAAGVEFKDFSSW